MSFLSLLQIHPLSERDPIKLSIHHYPVCTTYAFFTEPENPENKIIIKDPSSIEESVMDGKIVLGMNPYRLFLLKSTHYSFHQSV